jgi:hypothetical protein
MMISPRKSFCVRKARTAALNLLGSTMVIASPLRRIHNKCEVAARRGELITGSWSKLYRLRLNFLVGLMEANSRVCTYVRFLTHLNCHRTSPFGRVDILSALHYHQRTQPGGLILTVLILFPRISSSMLASFSCRSDLIAGI